MEQQTLNKRRPAMGKWAFLTTARIAAGLTQTEFAVRCDCVQTQVSRWERGEFPPNLQQIAVMAQVLEIPPQKMAAEAVTFFGNNYN